MLQSGGSMSARLLNEFLSGRAPAMRTKWREWLKISEIKVCEKWLGARMKSTWIFLLEMEMKCEFFDSDANWFWALAGIFWWWNGFLWAVSALMESLRAHFISIIRACVRTKQRKITTASKDAAKFLWLSLLSRQLNLLRKLCVYYILCVCTVVQLSFGWTHCMKLLDNAKITLAHLGAHKHTLVWIYLLPGVLLRIFNDSKMRSLILQLMHVYEFMNDAIILTRDSSDASSSFLSKS